MAKQSIPDIRIGDDYVIEITYPNNEITGFKFYLTLKNSVDDLDENAVLHVSHIAGNDVLDTPNSCFFSVPASVTIGLKKGKYFYGLKAISTSGDSETLAPPIADAMQKISVVPSATHAIK